jgi:cellulose synthase/poly-beta-1,6-N-acetylglucosamine synthase-like glycosyltransferase
VPGAIGAWRRQLLLEMGKFTDDTLAEDTDMTLKILRAGCKVEYAEDAIGFTEAPDTIKDFLKQRFRWMYGTMQAAWKNRDTTLRPKYKALGLLALPNIFIFQIFFPFISPLMDLAALASIGGILISIQEHPLDPLPTTWQAVVLFYALFLLLDFLTALFAFSFERKENWSLIVWLVPQRFFYRQLLYYVAIQAVITAIQGPMVGWNKLERKATVSLPPK